MSIILSKRWRIRGSLIVGLSLALAGWLVRYNSSAITAERLYGQWSGVGVGFSFAPPNHYLYVYERGGWCGHFFIIDDHTILFAPDPREYSRTHTSTARFVADRLQLDDNSEPYRRVGPAVEICQPIPTMVPTTPLPTPNSYPGPYPPPATPTRR